MASRAKKRKQEFDARSRNNDRAEIAELRRSVMMLGEMIKKLRADDETIAENCAEISLRTRYIMQHFKFGRGALVGLSGQPITSEIMTLFDLYLQDRDRFLTVLQQEYRDADGQAVPTNASAKAGHEADQPGQPASAGDAPSAPPPGPRLIHSA